MRSPRTAFDARLSIESGSANSRGFRKVRRSATATAAREYYSIQARLQMATITDGSTCT